MEQDCQTWEMLGAGRPRLVKHRFRPWPHTRGPLPGAPTQTAGWPRCRRCADFGSGFSEGLPVGPGRGRPWDAISGCSPGSQLLIKPAVRTRWDGRVYSWTICQVLISRVGSHVPAAGQALLSRACGRHLRAHTQGTLFPVSSVNYVCKYILLFKTDVTIGVPYFYEFAKFGGFAHPSAGFWESAEGCQVSCLTGASPGCPPASDAPTVTSIFSLQSPTPTWILNSRSHSHSLPLAQKERVCARVRMCALTCGL